MRRLLPLLVVVVAGCSIWSGSGPLDDLPDGTPLPYGTHYAPVFEGNESCVSLKERRGGAWHQIAVTTVSGNGTYGWETAGPPGNTRVVFCHASRMLGTWQIRLPELPPGRYRACADGGGCGEPVVIGDETET
jgi:hypothetical protein